MFNSPLAVSENITRPHLNVKHTGSRDTSFSPTYLVNKQETSGSQLCSLVRSDLENVCGLADKAPLVTSDIIIVIDKTFGCER